MTQGNSMWHDKPEVKIGDYGEELVRSFVESKKYICYKAVTDRAHLVDYFIFRNDKGVIAAEVKTKPRRRKYPDTGFDSRSYEAYKKFTDEHNMKMFIFFVDTAERSIYGNFLHKLDEIHKTERKVYPLEEQTKDGRVIRYYSLDSMIHITDLSEDEIKTLEGLRNGDLT